MTKYVKLTKYNCLHTIQNTLFIGKVFLHFPFLDSTNAYANELASKSNPSEGTVISTYNQRQGRGQIGSQWLSEEGKNISMSVILHPRFLAIRAQFLLSQAISLGVYDFVSGIVGAQVKIKWPNDLYIGNKKVAGILIQNTLLANQLHTSVIGIGINVNQEFFPSSIPNPTSLQLETGQEFILDELLVDLCQKLDARYLQLKAGRTSELKQAYLHHLYRFMEESLFERQTGEVFSGQITGVTEQGKLLIDHAEGEEAFDIKALRYLING